MAVPEFQDEPYSKFNIVLKCAMRVQSREGVASKQCLGFRQWVVSFKQVLDGNCLWCTAPCFPYGAMVLGVLFICGVIVEAEPHQIGAGGLLFGRQLLPPWAEYHGVTGTAPPVVRFSCWVTVVALVFVALNTFPTDGAEQRQL